ncbi:MAG: hypothetical protein JW776_02215 [Candidatus Lokiarchaeota archaeon]|nr:hypothetical protein [Candidatus Lokiarchaeota archaeon]
MSLGISSVAEFNTVITMLGFLCASVQAATGTYAAYYKGKISLLRTNDALNRSSCFWWICNRTILHRFVSRPYRIYWGSSANGGVPSIRTR